MDCSFVYDCECFTTDTLLGCANIFGATISPWVISFHLSESCSRMWLNSRSKAYEFMIKRQRTIHCDASSLDKSPALLSNL